MHVWVLDESTLVKPFLDRGFGFVDRQASYMNVINQGKVNVSGAADPRLRTQFRHIVNADFEEITVAQAKRGIPARFR